MKTSPTEMSVMHRVTFAFCLLTSAFSLLTSNFCLPLSPFQLPPVPSPRHIPSAILHGMDAVTLTRQLVDIESITGNEAAVGNYLFGELCRMGYRTKKMPVEGDRFNVYAIPGIDGDAAESAPAVTFSTHLDTVPPFI